VRLVSALTQANKAARDTGGDWAYIKLLYHATPAWSSAGDTWISKSVRWALGYVFTILIGAGLCRWGFHRKRVSAKTVWQDSLPLLSLVVWVPIFVRLLVLAGGIGTFQLHFWPHLGGLSEMMQGSCFENGVVLQRRHVGELIKMLRSPLFDVTVAGILNRLAVARGLTKWVMDPSIIL
jgi:hypothetical protein